jgi:hypothetical protein
MSSSVSNKVDLVSGGAVVGRPASDAVVAKSPANNGAVLKSPANDEAMAADDLPDDDSALADTAIVPIEGGGGGGGGGGRGGGRGSVPIEVTMLDIKYEEDVLDEAGFLKMEADDPELQSSVGGSVIRLLYYVVYTKEGRNHLLNYTYDRDAKKSLPQGTTRATLKGVLEKRFPYLEDERLEIALDAHFAASEYVNVVGNDNARADVLQSIYREKLAAMLGALYDDSMGRDFSCIW